MAKILRKNDVFEVDIESTGFEGEGIARIDGCPVFVRYAAEGDRAKIRIVKANKNYAFGKVEEIITSSKSRREVECGSYGKCGGCTLMHVNYEKQLEVKKQTVLNNLRKIAHLNEGDYIFDGIIGADEYNYRNKAQFPLAMVDGKAVYGFYAPGSHRVVKCNDCRIQNTKINQVADKVLEYVDENGISIYDETTHKGYLRHIYIRSAENGDFIVVLVTNSDKELPDSDKLLERLSKLDGLIGIIQNINKRTDNVILGNENVVVYGEDKIILTLSDLDFYVSPHSFFQVNIKQTKKLYDKALEYACLNGIETVFDLYCGVGSISLFLAKKAGKVYGVEIVKDAIQNAKMNAQKNGITNAEFHVGDCTEVVNRLISDGIRADVVVVDPPRKGCDSDLLRLVDEISPKRLVYVSCNSSTLARDIDLLSGYGYNLHKLVAVDMFPQTAHVECCALLCHD